MAVDHITPVVDIGGSDMNDSITGRLVETLKTWSMEGDKPVLPDELLYDDTGLPIWNEIIFTPEFYQTHDEMKLFDKNGAEIAAYFQQGVTVIDLGAGDTRKTGRLLAAFDKARVRTTYLALDISQSSLRHNIKYLMKQHSSQKTTVSCTGIWGSFEHGMEYLKGIKSPRLFLSLGSVLCNDPWSKALKDLTYWAQALREDDFLLIGMDGHLAPKDYDKIWAAYHSCDDKYRKFFCNGFDHANRLLGEDLFAEKDWEFLAEVEVKPTTRHRFYFRAKRDIKMKKIDRTIKKGDVFDWFDSHKYDEENVRVMCSKAGLSVVEAWQAPDSEFRQYLVRRRRDNDQRDDADSAVSGVN